MERRIRIVGYCRVSKPVDNQEIAIEVYDGLDKLICTRATRLHRIRHRRAEIRAEQLAIMLDGEFTGEFEDAYTLTASVISANEKLNGTMIQLGSFLRSGAEYRYFNPRAITGADPDNRLSLDEESIAILKANINKWVGSPSNI